jgi:integrase/recombinase XerD
MYPCLSRAVEGFLLNVAASGRSSNTIRNYKAELKRFVGWVGDNEINKIDSQIIENFMLYLKNDFRITHAASTAITPRKISQKTLSNAHGTLAVFWKWVSIEFQISNPFKVTPIKVYTKPIAPLKENEIQLLLNVCKRNKRNRSIILTLLDSGIRVSEMCSIRIKDIDFESGRVFITGKGSKSRFVYLGKVSRHALWSYLLERFPSSKPLIDDYLFVDRYGIHPLTRGGVLQLLKRLGREAGISKVHPHRMRHSFCVEYLRNGGNVFELQNMIGHSDLSMCRKYLELSQMDLETSAKRASPADNWRLK